MQIEPVTNGWRRVMETFLSDHVQPMRKFTDRHVLLIIDFDQHLERREELLNQVPEDLRERVYVIGSMDEPEDLFAAIKKRAEALGAALAEDCNRGTDEHWSHEMLAHNQAELARLSANVKPFLLLDCQG